MFTEVKRCVLQLLSGMGNQPDGMLVLLKSIVKHLLNKCCVCNIDNVERHYEPGVEINDDPDGIKNVFDINVGNVAHPDHIRRFRHEFLLIWLR